MRRCSTTLSAANAGNLTVAETKDMELVFKHRPDKYLSRNASAVHPTGQQVTQMPARKAADELRAASDPRLREKGATNCNGALLRDVRNPDGKL